LVIVEGSIGNLHKLNFVVDTGACPTLVDRAIAKRLGLATQPARVSLSNRSIQTEIAVLPSLAVGPIQVTSLPVLTQDLTLLGKAMGQNVDGIVGLDVLRKSNFSINYETRKMEFGAIERLPWFAVFETEAPIVTVRMEFLGRRFRIAIDTGGPDLMLFQTRISSGTDFRAFGSEEVKDLGGTYRRMKVLIPDVQLGEIRIGSQIAFVVDDRKDDGDNFDGVLGVKGAHFRRIAFDFGDRRFYWD
jgi:predicted aspartyl protease